MKAALLKKHNVELFENAGARVTTSALTRARC
jgi:hypothetical protein